ncbi:MAG: serine kinase [Candidatus Zhuqueibacterota bacterium]
MKLNQIVEKLKLTVATKTSDLNVDVTGGYVSDLLSDVMAHARKGNIWITLQIHQNTVAVATLKDLAGIVLIHGKIPAQETIQKAEQENVPILISDQPAFEVICGLCKMGITGGK